jgi:hypothetical protein
MKKIWIIVIAILVVGLVAGGSFWAGMAYNNTAQTNEANQARDNFIRARGTPMGGDIPNDMQFPGGGQGFIRGGTVGKIKSINGNVIEISTADNVTTVNLTDTTQISKTVSGMISDLTPGTQVMVTGETDANGAITAVRIQIVENLPAGMDNPPPAGTPSP